MERKQIVTFIGKSYANEGFKFYFSGPRTEICPKSCKFYNPCMMNLKPDTIYKVAENLGIEHICPSDYHKEPMVLVKVVESEIEILIESKQTFLGAVIKYEPINCDFLDCPYREYCTPIEGLKPGSKVKIISVNRKIKDNRCGGRSLSVVVIEKV